MELKEIVAIMESCEWITPRGDVQEAMRNGSLKG
jgi:hypothetical protein